MHYCQPWLQADFANQDAHIKPTGPDFLIALRISAVEALLSQEKKPEPEQLKGVLRYDSRSCNTAADLHVVCMCGMLTGRTPLVQNRLLSTLVWLVRTAQGKDQLLLQACATDHHCVIGSS